MSSRSSPPTPRKYHPIDFVRVMIEAGAKLQNTDADKILYYFRTMIRRERILAFHPLGHREMSAFCTFAMTDYWSDVQGFYHKRMWDAPSDQLDGSICYIDKLMAQEWSLGLRKQLQEILTWRFPRIRWAVWYRPGLGDLPDRRVVREIGEGQYAKV